MSRKHKTSQTQIVDVSILPLPELRRSLLTWFSQQQRDLPWRQTQDPYAIWVSEVMLQQTRVATVLSYYQKFLTQFPTLESLALAPLDQVLGLWSGLGYYRRARHLHEAAQEVLHRFSGTLPHDYHALLSIKGIGRYTAGAISSIAFQQPYPAVDGNVYRIFSRLFCLEYPMQSTLLQKSCETIAQEIVQGERPGDLNQALMELGALLCTPKNPSCLLCPIREHCKAYETGEMLAYPKPGKSTPVQDIAVQWAFIHHNHTVLLLQRPDDGLFAGMWEFPGIYTPGCTDETPDSLHKQIQQWGLHVAWQDTYREYQHVLTHRRLHIRLHQGQWLHGQPTWPESAYRWISPEQHQNLAIASITRKILVQFPSSIP